MRSHLAARSARLVLAAAAVTALAATATACGPEDIEDSRQFGGPLLRRLRRSDNSSSDSPSTGGSNAERFHRQEDRLRRQGRLRFRLR